MDMKLEPPVSSQALLLDVIRSSYTLPVLLAADRAGLFSSLHTAPASSEEIARRFDMSHRTAETLLGVLAAKGFLAQSGGRFHLLDVAKDFLLPGSPFYSGAWLDRYRSGAVNHESIYNALFKERTAFTELLDPDDWQSSPDPEQLRQFTAMIHAASFPTAMGVAAHGDFSGVRRLLDVAGGSGCYCIALGLKYPDMELTVMELPGVCDIIPEYTGPYGLGDRVRTVSADMFNDDWPAGYDAHFISNVFHDWGPQQCAILARKSLEALPSGGRIYLHEELANDTHDGPLETMLYSIIMAAWTRGGKQYSFAEFDEMLSSAGFRNTRVTYTYGRFSLVSAEKP
jgi:O-methyltransferase domain/Dimerisation domain